MQDNSFADNRPLTIDVSRRTMVLSIAVGALTGLIVTGLSFIIGRNVLTPLFCSTGDVAAFCATTDSVAGGIATVVAAIVAVFVLVAIGSYRPILISFASAAALWGVTTWFDSSVWYVALLSSIVLYATAYGAFSLLVRLRSFLIAAIAAFVVVILARIATIA